MNSRPLIALIAVASVLGLALVGLYAYDSSRADLVAEGISVAGVPLGGLTSSEARARLEAEVAEPLRRPVRIRAGERAWRLTARKARLTPDVAGMSADAVAASREGTFVGRSIRDLAGLRPQRDLQARVPYSKRAVASLVRQVKREADRKPMDARVEASGTGLRRVKERTGWSVNAPRLRRAIETELVLASSDRVVRAKRRALKPKVTRAALKKKYPTYVLVNRSGFQLTLYKGLKKVKSYPIAVGQSGLETPAGQYKIQNKAVNPDWQVPNSDWAGDKAGQLIPGGTAENPLKARWLGIFDGAGIHGTSEVGSLGTNASHGCVRMAIPDVTELYEKVPVGAPIYIA